MMDCLMGIDLGSTSLKAVVYDLDGNKVSGGSRPTERFHPTAEHPDWTVWQPEQIWGGTAEAIREAIARLPDAARVRAVAVTGMGMDGLPVDEQGNWLYPLISWHDSRTVPQLQWWLDNIGAEKQFSIGGNPLWPINSALRMRWVAEHEPEIYRRAHKWLLIEDFLNFMLCGRHVTDYSMASCTLLFDQRTRQWSDELLALSGIRRELLCEALPSGTRIGEIHAAAARATGLPVGTPVVLGGHDHLCGVIPVGAFRPGVALDVTGTWETVITSTPVPVLKEELRRAGMTVQAHVVRGLHAIWGGAVAGEMIEWYRRQLMGHADHVASESISWDTLMPEATAAAPGAGGIMFLPHMSGAACPVVDGQSLGVFAGLTPRATRGQMLRAIIEGLDYQFRDIVLAMENALGSELQRVIAVGGATRNEFWMQNKADVIGRPIEIPNVEEATPLGAAMLAGIGVGLYKDEEEAWQRVYRPGKIYEPNPQLAAQYVRWFAIYRDLYPATASVSHRLFKEFTT
ncbi:MAG: FGGY-family carbohydrate kinase [Pirellulaceae bacterium]